MDRANVKDNDYGDLLQRGGLQIRGHLHRASAEGMSAAAQQVPTNAAQQGPDLPVKDASKPSDEEGRTTPADAAPLGHRRNIK